jgi:hypothetical protein
VSQISLPIRIVVAVAVIFMAAWMTVLKPKAEEPIAPLPAGNVANGQPAVSEPGKLAEAAKSAVDSANAKAAAGEAAATGSAPSATGTATEAPSATTAGAAGTPAAAAITGVPKPIAKAIAADKVLVLLFWNRDSADDRAVKAAVARADRWNGRVQVSTPPIQSISKYGRITRGVDVEQSPTVVVVDRDLKATALVGYVDTQSVDQAVVDAFRASGGIFTSAYLRKVNGVCAAAGRDLLAIPDFNALGEAPTSAKRHSARWQRFVADLRAVPAPARFRAFKRATVADAAAMGAVLSTFAGAVAGHPGAAKVAGASNSALEGMQPVGKRFDARMDERHVLSCGSDA